MELSDPKPQREDGQQVHLKAGGQAPFGVGPETAMFLF